MAVLHVKIFTPIALAYLALQATEWGSQIGCESGPGSMAVAGHGVRIHTPRCTSPRGEGAPKFELEAKRAGGARRGIDCVANIYLILPTQMVQRMETEIIVTKTIH